MKNYVVSIEYVDLNNLSNTLGYGLYTEDGDFEVLRIKVNTPIPDDVNLIMKGTSLVRIKLVPYLCDYLIYMNGVVDNKDHTGRQTTHDLTCCEEFEKPKYSSINEVKNERFQHEDAWYKPSAIVKFSDNFN